MQELIETHSKKEQEIKSENARLQSAIQEGRDQDFKKNQKVVSSIVAKDRELEDLERTLHDES